MMRGAAALLVLAACAGADVRWCPVEAETIAVEETAVEVVNATGRPLPEPRSGLVDEIARRATRIAPAPFSTAGAFSAAATAALREKGVRTSELRKAELPIFRVTVRDLEVRDADSAGAVAFVSASYALLDAQGHAVWTATQRRVPVRLGGPDLTRAAVTRIATEAVAHALDGFPSTR
jgi:hypothetical protein